MAFKLKKTKRYLYKMADEPGQAFVQLMSLLSALVTISIALNYISSKFGVFLALIIGLFLIAPPVYLLFLKISKDVARIYNVGDQSSFVFSEIEQKWHVNFDGSRDIEVQKHFLFYDTPEKYDLVDTVFGSENISYADVGYTSSTSSIGTIEQPQKHAFNIHWQPPRKLFAGDRFTHKFHCKYPKAEQPLEKSFTLSAVTPSRLVRLIVTTDRIIEDIEIKTSFGEIKFWETGKIFAPSEIDHFGLVKKLTQHELIVERENLPIGLNIFVILTLSEE